MESAGTEPGIAAALPPGRQPRGLALAAAIATLFVSAALGGVIVRRWRRAAFWLLSDLAWYAVMIGAILAGHPRQMWVGLFATVGWRVPAAVDAYRLTRRASQIASWRSLIVTWLVLTLGAAGLAAGFVRPFLVEAFKIPSKSMYPALIVGDHVFANKVRRTPKRGDVIVFKYPLDESTDYIKRVIGLAGDVVDTANGSVLVNGVELPRDRVQEDCPKGPDGITVFEDAIPCVLWNETLDGRSYQIGTDTVLGERPMRRTVVPPNTVFVIGDNRDNSSDSRVWGPVPLANIKGTVTFIWWSSAERGVRWDRVDALVR